MTLTQEAITIALCAFATIICRFLPFVVFSGKRKTPEYVKYLGKALPAAIFAMLVVYCLKNVSISEYSHGIPELISILLTVGVHLLKRNILFSVAAGTVCYMLLVQLVF